MKILAINGSPRAGGNTALALGEMAKVFASEGMEMETVHIGSRLIRGCTACGGCRRNADERCVIPGDPVNEMVQKMKEADAIILGSPVHYAGIAGTMKSFCDRAFYVAQSNGGMFAGKVGASVVAVRRTGGSVAWQGLNFYLTISQMAVAGSTYWSVVHGAMPGEAVGDEEGMQTVRNAARSVVELLRNAEGKPRKELETGARTNFIR
jgi:multimeric flavodoxin WrbA